MRCWNNVKLDRASSGDCKQCCLRSPDLLCRGGDQTEPDWSCRNAEVTTTVLSSFRPQQASRWRASSASLPLKRTTARRADRDDSDSLQPCDCCGTRGHPSRRRVDMRKLLRRGITRDQSSCMIARAYFMAHPEAGMRTYNAGCAGESSLKS